MDQWRIDLQFCVDVSYIVNIGIGGTESRPCAMAFYGITVV
jgi:hypothetical protein